MLTKLSIVQIGDAFTWLHVNRIALFPNISLGGAETYCMKKWFKAVPTLSNVQEN